MEILGLVILFVVFGLVLTPTLGLLATWVDRKVTARVQYRVGPPWYQPFADVVKLMGKETIVPRAASKAAFLISPLIGLAGTTLASVIIWMAIIKPDSGFGGDLIVVVYLLILPALAMIFGGLASANPLASVGASREMKLVLAYELPFILMIVVVLIKSSGELQLGELVAAQQSGGVYVGSISGVLALIVAILCTQAKLGQVPFDAAEAETELTGGIMVEYSGTPLAMFKLTRAMLYFVVPMFVVILLCGGIGSWWRIPLGILKYVGLLVLVVLIRNTNPRLQIKNAIKFFWGHVTLLASSEGLKDFIW
ncbi:NAD(P)H-quinone oxidoreductase subunit 1, chloroplastic [subsurface metagenome]